MIRKIQLVAGIFFTATVSFAQEVKKDIVHTVEKGQTIYSIARTYKVQPEEIKALNPSVGETYSIKPGQVLKITIISPEEEVQPVNTTQPIKPIKEQKLVKEPKIHIVQAKETLYSLSRIYAVSLDDLKIWNKLSTNSIGIGQELIVGHNYVSKKTEPISTEIKPVIKIDSTENKPTVVTTEVPIVEKPVIAKPKPPVRSTNRYATSSKQDLLKQRYLSEQINGKQYKKEGVTIWFKTNNRMMRSSYYGLFSNVPVGSIVKVENLNNKRVVYVKVIGSLPNTAENTGAMMKLTPAAQKLLKTSDAKVRVRVTYAE